MEKEAPSEAIELVDSYVPLEDDGNECCGLEDVEAPVVVDDHSEGVEDYGSLEYSRYLAGGILEPTLGMEFSSEEDARNYYNAYAKQMGFSIRVNSYYRSKKDNLIISREFCCSKEGFRRVKRLRTSGSEDGMKKRRARPITREGCEALMTVRRRDDGKWYVAKLEKNHNHELVTPAMRHFLRAVQRVFPQSKHRYCKWHIMRKVPKEMGQVYSALPKTFQLEFEKYVNKTEMPEEFESSWQLLLDKYNLRGNEWLQSLYIDRKLWVSTYLRDIFFAGMHATQQSGSVNSLFEGYVNARTTLQDFAEQYEKALDDRNEKEARAEFETFYTKPVLKTPLPMEKQIAEVYTRKLFSIFQDEIFESLVLAVKLIESNGETSTYEIARFDEEEKAYFVALNVSEQIASCSCKMFEFEGILCRHVIAVFKATNIFMLPQHYILKRWTKSAKDEAVLDVLPSVALQSNSQKGKNSYYDILHQEAVKCAEEGMVSDRSFKVALDALREARIKIVEVKKNAMNAPKLETMTSTSNQEIVSQVDSSSVLLTPPDHPKAKVGESCTESIISEYALEQSSRQENSKVFQRWLHLGSEMTSLPIEGFWAIDPDAECIKEFYLQFLM
ncbi:hypothetical protein Patl1_21809 [Pistacia atlantica]|uniref:Uncharacterized protein n=1 Tax=Pistacia atlantica TaxID=434234 RepID=A0ACC1BI83_9ROSI|nr:hypothetical protein Patl1_21809 [Pistacia atlantica]